MFAAFCFVLGLIVGAFVWVPVITIREAERRHARSIAFARRVREQYR